jgi:hypothetical protein
MKDSRNITKEDAPSDFMPSDVRPVTFTGLILLALLYAQVVDPQTAIGSDSESGRMPANLTIFIVRGCRLRGTQSVRNAREVQPGGTAEYAGVCRVETVMSPDRKKRFEPIPLRRDQALALPDWSILDVNEMHLV